ncbi:MAG: hypothetical protein ABS76_32030 [Pelagibacterium sp. SCN 64-44]|nr:MAG: hypothetical protein ABS76_32030 [Pelagibacterium sp. SCN 64-44]
MCPGILARLLAVLTVILGIAAAISVMGDKPATQTSFFPTSPASSGATLRAELQRCRDLGQDAADDADCAAAWSESQARFLMRDGAATGAR